MVYMGSKSKYAQYIVPILQKVINDNNIHVYIEPFVGGANIIDKIKCEVRYGYDRSDTLIALLTQARDDFSKVLAEGSRELWDKGKGYVKDGIMPEDMTLADIGAMEFFASFSSRGYPGGYANNTAGHDYFKERRANLEKQSPNLKGILFYPANYYELAHVSGAVIYCDPPYANTKQYGYASQEKMDHQRFWNWVREMSKDNYVFVSEQTAPDDFEAIWEIETKRTVGSDNNFKATEKLFRYKDGLK